MMLADVDVASEIMVPRWNSSSSSAYDGLSDGVPWGRGSVAGCRVAVVVDGSGSSRDGGRVAHGRQGVSTNVATRWSYMRSLTSSSMSELGGLPGPAAVEKDESYPLSYVEWLS